MDTIISERPRAFVRRLLAVALCLSATLAGCLTIEEMAPPVGPEWLSAATGGATCAVLEKGRQVYLTDCTRCHSVEPIDRYSRGHWRIIIERMGPQSKLDVSRTEALQAYILAAHKMMGQTTATKQ